VRVLYHSSLLVSSFGQRLTCYFSLQSATFGPFNRQVVIMNTDGKTYTLLENPQAMRLKKAGFIKNRQFITQPTQEDLEAALPVESEGGGIGGAIQGLFGGSE